MAVTVTRDLGTKLCKALGISAENVRSITINIEVDEATILVTRQFITRDQMDRAELVLAEETWVPAVQS